MHLDLGEDNNNVVDASGRRVVRQETCSKSLALTMRPHIVKADITARQSKARVKTNGRRVGGVAVSRSRHWQFELDEPKSPRAGAARP
jgi:hypothetical protein